MEGDHEMARMLKGTVLAVVVCLAATLGGCTSASVPPSSPTAPQSSSTQSSLPTQPPVTAQQGSPVPTDSASGALGVVDVNQTFFDGGIGFSITIEKTNTVWVPYLPVTADDSGVGLIAGMLGIRVSVDGANATFLLTTLQIYNMEILAADKTQTGCQELLSYDADLEYTQAILAAIGGDKAYSYDSSTRSGDGWVICTVDNTSASAFDTGGFDIGYHRNSGKTSDGTPVPGFSFSVPVGEA